MSKHCVECSTLDQWYWFFITVHSIHNTQKAIAKRWPKFPLWYYTNPSLLRAILPIFLVPTMSLAHQCDMVSGGKCNLDCFWSTYCFKLLGVISDLGSVAIYEGYVAPSESNSSRGKLQKQQQMRLKYLSDTWRIFDQGYWEKKLHISCTII